MGVNTFVVHHLETNKGLPVVIITLPLFLLVVILFEVNYRVINKIGQLKFDKTKNQNVISVAQFEEFTKKGRKLAIIDNLIIDYGEYHMFHPGG